MLFQDEMTIPVGKVMVNGNLTVPFDARGLVIFSHGSGSSRFSKRNQAVADFLQKRNFATLLFDLLTESEDKFYFSRFNINLLTKRLIAATKWVETFTYTKDLPIGFFGASTGAASALKAAAALPEVSAVVSRGGRPDLAMDEISKVQAPTILIVGSLDTEVIELNKKAYRYLHCEKKIAIVNGATHLFEEPGKLEEVAELAASWFEKYLIPAAVDN